MIKYYVIILFALQNVTVAKEHIEYTISLGKFGIRIPTYMI